MTDRVQMIHMPWCPKAANSEADCDCNPRQIFPKSAVERTLESMMDPRPPKRIKDTDALKAFRLSMIGEPCERCGLRRGIHAHHKKFRSQGGNDTADELEWVCGICHDEAHGITSFWPGEA